MKSVGIVGLPGAGTSTLFTALTAIEGSASSRTHQAVVPVPDERVNVLGKLHDSKKLVFTQLRFVETSGMVRRGARGSGSLASELLGHLREADALLLVVRGFGPDANPSSELEDLNLELTLADLAIADSKLERGSKAARAGDAEAKRELSTIERAKLILEKGTPLRDETWDADERKALSSFAPLTIKPALAVVTIDPESPINVAADMIGVASALEAEVAGMDDGEAAELLSGYGIEERALAKVIRTTYDKLDLITFLTAGDTESRSWETRKGATAPEAAGEIHTDIQRGFIKAEVVPYDALVEAGSWSAAKSKGLIRQEGKEYVMREGDVVEFRFAV
ncbi:MAG: YchF family ATPase [Actinobacteria bacterium]|nr:YchF family ATPase [Actinomycetota bacterium]